MDVKQIMITVIGIAVTVLVVAAVTADSSTTNTPLYMVRMEQVSSEMNFLPTTMNTFTYTTEKGCTVNYNINGYCGTNLLGTSGDTMSCTCWPQCWTTESTCTYNHTCYPYLTCYGHLTCYGYPTCTPTLCQQTCATCVGYTCDQTSCQQTCATCDQPTCPDTCEDTCDGHTCSLTCPQTCIYSCEQPCEP